MSKLALRWLVVVAVVITAVTAVAQSINGTYAGFSQQYNSDVYMRFSGGSRVDVRIVNRRSGEVKVQQGSYNQGSGTMSIDGVVFVITRSRDTLNVRESQNSLNSYQMRPRSLPGMDWGSGWGTGGSGWGNVGDGGHTGNQQRPPTWLVGEFDGYNRVYDADINLFVTSNGAVTARIRYHDGRRVTQTGSYSNNRISLAGTWFETARTDSGIRTSQVNDRNNWMEYSRKGSGIGGGFGSGGVGSGGTRPPDAPPAWARGNFEGYNSKYGADIDVSLDNRGYLKARIRYRDGRRVNQDGWYRGGKIVIGGTTFNVARQGDGFRLTQTDDQSNSTLYRKTR